MIRKQRFQRGAVGAAHWQLRAIPGFVIYSDKLGVVALSTNRGRVTVDAEVFHDDLAAIIHIQQVLNWAKGSAKWVKRAGTARDDVTYKTSVPLDIVRPKPEADAPKGVGRPKPVPGELVLDPVTEHVLAIDLVLRTTKRGALLGFDLAVVHNDSQALIRKLAKGGPTVVDLSAFENQKPIAGAVHTYRFRRGGSGSSRRAAKLLREFREMTRKRWLPADPPVVCILVNSDSPGFDSAAVTAQHGGAWPKTIWKFPHLDEMGT